MCINENIEMRSVIACVKNMNVAVLKTRMSLSRRFGMCYLIAKNFNDVGCLALQTEH